MDRLNSYYYDTITKDNKELKLKIVKTSLKRTYFNCEGSYLLVRLGKYHNMDEIKKYLLKYFNKFCKIVDININYQNKKNILTLFGIDYNIIFSNINQLYLIKGKNIHINLKYKEKVDKIIDKIIIIELTEKLSSINNEIKDKLANYNISLVPIKIKNLKRKFGYCDIINKKIVVAKFISKLDIKLIKHLLFHEYCHFIYKNHSKEFYNLLYIIDENGKEHNKEFNNIKIKL